MDLDLPLNVTMYLFSLSALHTLCPSNSFSHCFICLLSLSLLFYVGLLALAAILCVSHKIARHISRYETAALVSLKETQHVCAL